MSEDEVPIFLPGFNIIGEMSKEHLIEEVMLAQRETLDGQTVEQLKVMVVQIRMSQIKSRLMSEAGIQQGPFGFFSTGGGVATDDE